MYNIVPVITAVVLGIVIKMGSGDDATDYDVFKRFVLVASNVFFLYIPIYCVKFTLQKPIPFFSLIPEIIFSTLTCACSTVYHMCDSGPKNTNICLATWQGLYYLDFIFSFQILHVVFVYSPYFTWATFLLKCLYLSIILSTNIAYVTTYYNGPFDKWFYLFCAVCGFVTLAGRIIYYKYCDKQMPHMLEYHFNWRIGLTALICAIIGIVFKVATPDQYDYYWWGHALWHLFIAFGIYFSFVMYDSFLCTDKESCPVCDNDNRN
jgi:hypothetical protein